jgi:hypothetical protein
VWYSEEVRRNSGDRESAAIRRAKVPVKRYARCRGRRDFGIAAADLTSVSLGEKTFRVPYSASIVGRFIRKEVKKGDLETRERDRRTGDVADFETGRAVGRVRNGKDIDRLFFGIDDLILRHAEACVDVALLREIVLPIGRREYFDCEIGWSVNPTFGAGAGVSGKKEEEVGLDDAGVREDDSGRCEKEARSRPLFFSTSSAS